jgi:hypothetical protein
MIAGEWVVVETRTLWGILNWRHFVFEADHRSVSNSSRLMIRSLTMI